MANPGGDAHITDTVGAGNAAHGDRFSEALINEVLACRSQSSLAHVVPTDKLAAATQKTQTEIYGLPPTASDQEMCAKEAEFSATNGRQAVAKFVKGLDKGDLETLNGSVLDMHQFNRPFVEKADHDSVDNLLDRKGLGHSWSKDGDLSIFKENGLTTTIATMNGLNETALQVENDGQGHIVKATPVQPQTAIREMLAQ